MVIVFADIPAPLIILLAVIVTIILGFRYQYGKYWRDKNNPGFLHYLVPQRLSPSDERLLQKTFQFYNRLSPRKRKIYGSRIKKFILDKNFESRESFEITEEMKVLIAATAMRVTLGLKSYIFPTFHTILIYPEMFYSRFSKAVVKGETNMAGMIVFSWKDFEFGISDENDNLNLGYHEFGHALFVERFKQTMEYSFERNYENWDHIVFREKKLKEAALKGTFRKYATYNRHEFFAVAVENFFERPERFKSDLPKLYSTMTKLLNQDPLAIVKRYDQKAF